MTEVKINKRLYLVPTEWNEVTGPQLVQIIRVLHTPDVNAITQLLRLLKIVSGMSWWRFYMCPADQLHESMYLLNFIFEGNTLTNNPLPKVGGLYGPAANFENLRMDEFIFCEDHFFAWQDDKQNMAHLNHLVAMLYRKGKRGYDHKRNPDGDHRQPFNQYVAEYQAQATIARWPVETKLSIAHWYGACRNQLIKDFPKVYTYSGGEAARWGLVSTMRNVATGGVHGTFADVEKMFVRMLMIELDEMISEAEKLPKTTAHV